MVTSYETEEQSIKAEQIIVHEKYYRKPHFDIALIKLNKKVYFQDHICPITLPNFNAPDPYPSVWRATVVGWGTTDVDYTLAESSQIREGRGKKLSRAENLQKADVRLEK